MSNTVRHENKNGDNGRGLSGAVFRGLYVDKIRNGDLPGVFVHEDFIGNTAAPATGAGVYRGFTLDTAGVDISTYLGGAFSINAAATSEISIATPKFCQIDSISANSTNTPAGFEARLKIADIVDSTLVVGLTAGVGTTVFAAGSYNAGTFLGLRMANGVIQGMRDGTQIGSDSSVVGVNDTYLKLGVKIDNMYDGTGPEVTLYANGLKVCVINKNTDSGFAADGAMSAFAYMYSVAGTKIMTIDKLAFAALY
jgi:hypothetical protein